MTPKDCEYGMEVSLHYYDCLIGGACLCDSWDDNHAERLICFEEKEAKDV